MKSLDQIYSSKELRLEAITSLQNYSCAKNVQEQTGPFLQGLAFFVSTGSAQRSRRSFCCVFSSIPGTRAADRSLDCILKNPTDGRENVTLITSEKNRLTRSLNRNLSLPFLAGIQRHAEAVWSWLCCSGCYRLPFRRLAWRQSIS